MHIIFLLLALLAPLAAQESPVQQVLQRTAGRLEPSRSRSIHVGLLELT
jgi:hypothetical protein